MKRVQKLPIHVLLLAGLASSGLAQAADSPPPMTPGIGTGEALQAFAAPSPHPDRSPPPIAPGNPDLYHSHPGTGTPAPHRHRPNQAGGRP